MQTLQFNLFNIIMLFGCLQGFFLAFLLISSTRFNKKSNLFLAILVFVVSVQVFFNAILDIGLSNHYPFVWYLPLSWTLLVPFALYYFIQYLIKPDYTFKSKEYLLLIPFLCQFVFRGLFLVGYFMDAELLTQYDKVWNIGCHVFELASVIFCLMALILIVKKLNQHENELRDNFAELEGRSLTWVKYTMVGIFVLWGTWTFPYLYMLVGGSGEFPNMYALNIGMALIIYWLGYSMYLQRELFEVPALTDSKVDVAEKRFSGNEMSAKTDQHYQNLLSLMEKEQLYTDPELNMTLLAEKMGLSNGYLSQIINQKEGKNFFDFVNFYRIEAVKSRLKDPKYGHFSILGIAMDAGFKSKSTFNAVFKKMTGQTPSSFRKTG